jgi:hypothetical protein
MSRKHEPVAEIGVEDYRIVRHTHDVELATKLMRSKLIAYYGCPGDGKSPDGFCRPFDSPDCPHPHALGRPQLEWIRIVPALPGTFAESEGWKFTYQPTKPHARGAFPAVVFT